MSGTVERGLGNYMVQHALWFLCHTPVNVRFGMPFNEYFLRII